MADIGSAHNKRSTLEEDGCSYISGLGNKLLEVETLDSGVGLSFRDDCMPSINMSENDVETQRQPSLTCESMAADERMETAVTSLGHLTIGEPEATPEQTSSLRTDLELFKQDDDGDTKLHLAIIQPNACAAMWLTAAMASYSPDKLDVQNYEFRQTALHLAVITDQPGIVRMLVICGASADVRDRHGNSAIHLACSRGKSQCTWEMTRPVSEMECTQLMEYCRAVQLPVFEPPCFRRPDLSAMDYDGYSCLHLAFMSQSSDRLAVINHLINTCGADINIQDGKSGNALLHLAVKQRDLQVLSYLLQHPALDVNLPNYSRCTALDIADNLKHYDIVEQLSLLRAKHSTHYTDSDSSSETDEDKMEDYDDLVVGGQRLNLNHR